MKQEQPRWTDAVALIIPTTCPADDALRARSNRFLLQDGQSHNVGKPKGSRRRQAIVAKLTSAAFAGDRCVVLGSSRAAAIQLPQDTTIDRQHAFISIDCRSGHMKLTDTSRSGIWIQDHSGTKGQYRRLHRASVSITRDTRFRIGPAARLAFLIRPTSGLTATPAAHLSRVTVELTE